MKKYLALLAVAIFGAVVGIAGLVGTVALTAYELEVENGVVKLQFSTPAPVAAGNSLPVITVEPFPAPTSPSLDPIEQFLDRTRMNDLEERVKALEEKLRRAKEGPALDFGKEVPA